MLYIHFHPNKSFREKIKLKTKKDGKLSLLSRADDEYGFNSAGRSRSPPPRHYERSYDDRTRDYAPVRSYDDRGRSDAMPSRN